MFNTFGKFWKSSAIEGPVLPAPGPVHAPDKTIDVKRFMFFYFGYVFYVFNVFLFFSTFFIYKKSLTKRYANDEKHL